MKVSFILQVTLIIYF